MCRNVMVVSFCFVALFINVVVSFPVNKPPASSAEKQMAPHNQTAPPEKSPLAQTSDDKDSVIDEDDDDTLDSGSPYSSPFDLPRFVQSDGESVAKKTKEELMIAKANEFHRDQNVVRAQRKRTIASQLRKAAGK